MVTRPAGFTREEDGLTRPRPQGNKRGPKPGAGNNQGTGTPDRADRTSQGVNNNSTLSSGGGTTPNERPRAPQAPQTPQRSGGAATQSSTDRVSEINNLLESEVDEARRANLERERALITRLDPASGPDPNGSTPEPIFQDPESGVSLPSTGNAGLDALFAGTIEEITALDITAITQGNIEEIVRRHTTPDGSLASLEELIVGDQFVLDREGRQIVRDTQTGQVGFFEDQITPAQTIEDPPGSNNFVEVPEFNAGPRFVPTTDINVLKAYSEYETKLQIMRAEQDFVQQELEARSESERQLARDLFQSQLAILRDQAIITAEQRFDQEQSAVAFDRQAFLQNSQNAANQELQGLQNAWQETQNTIDRQIQVAQFNADQALRNGEFDLAKQRFGFERALSTAGFMLQAMQFVTDNPQMIVMMREAGVFGQLTALTGVDFGFLEGRAEGEAASSLENAELPPLREWQQMPPDEQQAVLFNLSMTIGVQRELIVQEIERRAQGFGLAGSQQVSRVPAGI